MSKYRNDLPQLGDALFLTDGGLETTLIFHEGVDLPHFAAFDLMKDETGLTRLRRYYETYLILARRHAVGVVLEAPTWRANRDWAGKLGYDAAELAAANRKAIGLLSEIRTQHETEQAPIVISGNVGPRGDGYRADQRMTAGEARRYHAEQIDTFADTDADMISAFTINYVEEAIGIVQAARAVAMPAVISFTTETDGRLPCGDSLESAIARTDQETDGYAAYYMINCAHPTHFAGPLQSGAAWLTRVRGLRANASRCSHAELDECTQLDVGNPRELGAEYRSLRARLPHLSVLGGCCGTDHRHVDAIFTACAR